MRDTNTMHKILPTMFRGLARTWYHNFDLGSILKYEDLYMKLTTRFSKRILVKKISAKPFAISRREHESTEAYLIRFNEKNIKGRWLTGVFVATKDLINRVDDSVLWRALCLHESNILKIKQVMKNYIQGKENDCGETLASIFS